MIRWLMNLMIDVCDDYADDDDSKRGSFYVALLWDKREGTMIIYVV